MPRLRAANRAHTTLDGALNDSATTISVVDASVFSAPPFRAVIQAGDDFEIVEVTGIATNDLTVAARGSLAFPDDTSAQSWDSGAVIAQEITAGYSDEKLTVEDVAPILNSWTGTGLVAILPGWVHGGNTSRATVAGRAYFQPFRVPRPLTTRYIMAWRESGGTSGNLGRMAIYAMEDMLPTSRVFQTGTFAVHTGSDILETMEITLQPGWYVTAFVSDGTPSFRAPADNSIGLAPVSAVQTGIGSAINMTGLAISGTDYVANGFPATFDGTGRFPISAVENFVQLIL
jgi:hypothetical protein